MSTINSQRKVVVNMLKSSQRDFIRRHIGPSDEDQNKMLSELGFKNLDDLISKTVPENILLKEELEIGEPNSEYEALRKLKVISKKNEIYSFHRCNKYRKEPIQFSPVCGDIERCNDICSLLLILCQAICSQYGCEVVNFSTSFADGKATLLLIHQYHPNIVRIRDILPTSSDLRRGSMNDPDCIRLAVNNERSNCLFASEKMLEIGGIPNMFPISDSYNVPDERAIIICIAYLFARLFESAIEFNAANVIQRSYREYRKRKHSGKFEFNCVQDNATYRPGLVTVNSPLAAFVQIPKPTHEDFPLQQKMQGENIFEVRIKFTCFKF